MGDVIEFQVHVHAPLTVRISFHVGSCFALLSEVVLDLIYDLRGRGHGFCNFYRVIYILVLVFTYRVLRMSVLKRIGDEAVQCMMRTFVGIIIISISIQMFAGFLLVVGEELFCVCFALQCVTTVMAVVFPLNGSAFVNFRAWRSWCWLSLMGCFHVSLFLLRCVGLYTAFVYMDMSYSHPCHREKVDS